jgi:hypothetical protein
MSSGSDFGLFLAGSSEAASLELADTAGNVTTMSAAVAVHFVEQSASRLCVNDAYTLTRSALIASSLRERPRTLASICRLASECRLLCLTAAEFVTRSAGGELLDATPPSSSTELAHLAPKLLDRLRRVASSVEMTGDEGNGPLGFHFRVRAAVACGAVSTSTLPLDQRVLPDVVAKCRTITSRSERTSHMLRRRGPATAGRPAKPARRERGSRLFGRKALSKVPPTRSERWLGRTSRCSPSALCNAVIRTTTSGRSSAEMYCVWLAPRSRTCPVCRQQSADRIAAGASKSGDRFAATGGDGALRKKLGCSSVVRIGPWCEPLDGAVPKTQNQTGKASVATLFVYVGCD